MSETVFGTEYLDEDWPHGLRCAQCDRLMQDGDRYSERLESFVDEFPVVLIVCVGCAISPASDGSLSAPPGGSSDG